jgi:UDP-N-acetylmuramoyl-L-alanyl-D-glutamate--2,6-diaminopimelate ligase
MDDPYGRRLAATLTDPVRVGWSEEVRAEEISSNWKGSPFRLVMPSGVVAVHLSLVGRFSIANALVAAGCAYALGYSPQNVKEGLEAVSQIPGRFQLVSGDEPMAVVVDYAHTPDGIAAAVSSARSLVDGRVIVVVGAGGDRDVSKRPLMGAAAAAADLVVVTSDNPRSEDPDRIIDQVLAGVGTAQAVRVPDRRMAIRAAIESGGAGDMILILGKGHEPGQEIAGRVLAFNDREVASEELAVARRKAEI